MTLFQLILLQLTAHFAADFILQPETWCEKKEKKVFTTYHVFHALIVFVTSWLFSFDWYFVMTAFVIALSHYFIDALKSYVTLKHENKKDTIFFADQFLHMVILTMLSWFYMKNFLTKPMLDIQFNTRITAIMAAFVFCSKPANIYIKNIFDFFHVSIPIEDKTDEKDLPNAGKIIGIMERFMTLALVVSSQYAAVGLIIAAKSILRFNAPQKNEYILVGTLLSFGIAILTGVLINTL